MDLYWSIAHCGWVRCPPPGDPLSSLWGERSEAEAIVLKDLPVQRSDEQVPAEH